MPQQHNTKLLLFIILKSQADSYAHQHVSCFKGNTREQWRLSGGGKRVGEGGCCTSGKCQLQAPGSLTLPDLHPAALSALLAL